MHNTPAEPCSPQRPIAAALFCLVATLCMGLPTAAQAVKHPTTDTSGEASPKSAGKTKFYRGSEETTKERDRRLSRECKGMTNAGACAGYTR